VGVIIASVFAIQSFSFADVQDSCGTVYNPAAAISLTQLGGKYLTASGTLRVLLVFVSYPDDDNTHPYWPAHQPPTNMSSYIDPSATTNSTNFANLTNYFRQMSLGLYTVIGEAVYVEAPHTQTWYNNNGYGRGERNKDVLQNAVNPLANFSNYDNWTRVADYNHQNVPNGTVDMIVMVWRGFQYYLGEASLGGGTGFQADGVNIELGYLGSIFPSEGSGVHCSFPYNYWPEKLLQTMAHEIGHWLLGSSHPYGSGSVHSVHSILGYNFASGVCANTFERERLGWINPTPVTAVNAPLADYITTGVAYKYQPSGGGANEYYYFENHQKLSVYDDATTNSDDKGIWVIHQLDNYNGTNNIRLKPQDGLWDWQNPGNNTSCFPGFTIPAFKKYAVNRNSTGYSNRDQLPKSGGGYDWLQVYINQGNQSICGGFLRGDPPFYGAFNPTNNTVFSRWSNPTANTWTDQAVNFAMEVLNQSGNVINVHFYIGDPESAPPSKPQNLQVSTVKICSPLPCRYRPKLTWDANIEPDMNSGTAKYYIYRKVIYAETGEVYCNWTFVISVSYSATSWIDSETESGLLIEGGFVVFYKIKAKDNTGLFSTYSLETSIGANSCGCSDPIPITQRSDEVELLSITDYSLLQNYPDPFNPQTVISFTLPDDNHVKLIVYDVLGREVKTLVDEFRASGRHNVVFDARDLPSGVYYYRVFAGRFTDMKKMILIR
jgi:M6 family metalloprotease-like protein